MNQKEKDKMQDKVSNAIWDVIKEQAENGTTFHWELAFKDKKGNLIEFEEGDIDG
jgi:hypothetical protein